MHTQPQTNRPPLTQSEARQFHAHHVIEAGKAYVSRDERMRRFHQMRADYLRAAIETGAAK